MFDIIQKFFAPQEQATSTKEESTAQHNIYVATCALLVEMAQIDGEFSEQEKENLIRLLESEYTLSRDYINEITAIAEKKLKTSNDLWKFTNLINQNYDPPEKIKIIELIWKIVYSDGKLDKYEDYLIHKLARLLNLQHSELIDAKLRVLHKESS
jgi:uncharacterized tellurite resistance protein B-like protein